MKAALIHAVLAGGVNDPRRLALWSADPQALRALGVDPASLDLQALRGFAGLALKVRHNGLRDAYIHTFRLLGVAGLEIELFADYALALAAAGGALANSNEERGQDLIDFIRRWHDPRQATHALLWDLVRHEQALLQLAQPMTAVPAADPLSRPTPGSVPRVRGTVRLHEMQHDPRVIVQVLRQREPALDSIAAMPCALCYWRPEGESSVYIVELDAFGFAALQAADGRRSVSDLSAVLGLSRRPPARVLRLLTQLRDAGLLAYAGRARGRSS
jgi:hypothetical protein